MAIPRSTVANAMESASRSLAGAQAAIAEEAAWIGRNSLGNDPAYLRASILSRRHEIDRAHAEAIGQLDAASAALGMSLR